MHKNQHEYERRKLRFGSHEVTVIALSATFSLIMVLYSLFGRIVPTASVIDDENDIQFIRVSSEEVSSAESNLQSSAVSSQVHVKVMLININNADAYHLSLLKGIGEKKAKSIIEYREKNGPFEKISDIKKVDGIGDGIFKKIREYITVE